MTIHLDMPHQVSTSSEPLSFIWALEEHYDRSRCLICFPCSHRTRRGHLKISRRRCAMWAMLRDISPLSMHRALLMWSEDSRAGRRFLTNKTHARMHACSIGAQAATLQHGGSANVVIELSPGVHKVPIGGLHLGPSHSPSDPRHKV